MGAMAYYDMRHLRVGAVLGLLALSLQPALAQDCFLWFCQHPGPMPPGFPGAPGFPGGPAPGRPTFSQPAPAIPAEPESQYALIYGPVEGEPFPVRALRLTDVDPVYLRRVVFYPSNEAPGTIVVDAQHHFLYLVQEGGRALRYGVGVGREGFAWSGVATVHDKQQWPDWYPPKEMLQRQPELMRAMSELQSGIGMHGGPRNPLGARALYLWQGNKDTLFRIHGTIEPWTIGKSVSSGCIRMINQDIIDLYQRAPVGTKVVVLPARHL
jgi:lipoprotein-anchoring transpeptidase ErfK/SrfK